MRLRSAWTWRRRAKLESLKGAEEERAAAFARLLSRFAQESVKVGGAGGMGRMI